MLRSGKENMSGSLNMASNASHASAIMEPVDSPTYDIKVHLDHFLGEMDDAMQPDLLSGGLQSLNIHGMDEDEDSFQLMDNNEMLLFQNSADFCKKLKSHRDQKIKVVSIFGNTGDGKSHTMNQVFFDGKEIFKTSPEQHTVTLGVRAAMQPDMNVLCLDTEGLLGATSSESKNIRILLKILAISDIIIFRTRAERLHSDMFKFLGTASKAFTLHFAAALQTLGLSAQSSGPAVVIFHETRSTKPLESTVSASTEDLIRQRFSTMKIDLEAFSSLRYIGIRTDHPPTNFRSIKNALKTELENTAVRSPRHPDIIFKVIETLNMKFSGKIEEPPLNFFPEQYFTCGSHCKVCDRRCERSMSHINEGGPHKNSENCRYQHQYENKVYLCKKCYINGHKVVVELTTHTDKESSWIGYVKLAWSGSVIDCPNCGEIYRSRKHFYGNDLPEANAVRAEIVHVWKDNALDCKPKHSGQMVLDGVTYLSETMSNISAQPAKAVKDWVTDRIAPAYWRPNNEIIHCHACKINFDQTGLKKHHCRGCGEGFCNPCSSHEMKVPGRNWGDRPERVCNDCREILVKSPNARPDVSQSFSNSSAGAMLSDSNGQTTDDGETDNRARRCGEAVANTLSSVAQVFDYPKNLIKDSVRPAYWVPDSDALKCNICSLTFGTPEEVAASTSMGTNSPNRHAVLDGSRHHCRSCGHAVCNKCSLKRRPVVEHGWTTDTRVCDACNDKAKTD